MVREIFIKLTDQLVSSFSKRQKLTRSVNITPKRNRIYQSNFNFTVLAISLHQVKYNIPPTFFPTFYKFVFQRKNEFKRHLPDLNIFQEVKTN